MATLGIESGTVDNRTFSSATGLGKKFKDWVVKTPSNHGPGWFIYDDQAALVTNPYLVVCNQSSPTANSKAIFMRFFVDSSAERIYFAMHLGWDLTNHVGIHTVNSRIVNTLSASFAYYFRGGADILMIITRTSGSTVTWARASKWTGIWDGSSKMLEPESTSGVLVNPAIIKTDPGGYLSGFENLTGYAASLDANGKLYFSIILYSGTTYFTNIYKDAARTQLVGHTGYYADTNLSAKGVTADNSSGLGGSIKNDITATAVTNIDCRFNRLDLGTGQGAAFRVNKFYFLVDLAAEGRVSYVKVLSKSGDQLVVDRVSPNGSNWGLNFGAGSIISPYPHRWIMDGNGSYTLPYAGYQGYETGGSLGGIMGVPATADYMSSSLSRMAPDSEGDFACMPPWYGDGYNRMFGKDNTIIVSSGSGLAALLDRRVISGVPYLCYSAGGIAFSVIDQESLS